MDLSVVMCGILGAVSPRIADIAPAVWDESLAALAHRGPDSRGLRHMGGITLGHTRLRVVDLSTAADQPVTSSNGRWSLVFNGEIYNFRELSRQMRLDDCPESDTRVLVELISAFGIDVAMKHVQGMFAFAAFDSHSKELWLVRDQFGEKPLYYWHGQEQLVFASELRPITLLMNSLGSCPRMNRTDFGDFYVVGYMPNDKTVVSGVLKLPPGHYLRTSLKVSESELIPVRWASEWQVHDSDLKQSPLDLRSALSDAIGDQLIADVPVGTFLSGGVDSTLVSMLAADQMKSRILNTFSIGFSDPKFDETRWAREVAAVLGTNHHSRIMTSDDALEMYFRNQEMCSDPIADPSVLPTLFLSKIAKEHVTVSLSGDGADELFGGYTRYRRFERFRRLMGFPLARSATRKLLKSPRFVAHPRAARLRNRRFSDSGESIDILSDYLPFVTQTSFRLPCAESDGHPVSPSGLFGGDPGDWARAFDVATYLPNDILAKVDRASMAYSLEVRAPFLDPRVAKYASFLTYRDLRGDSGGKRVLKEMVAARFGGSFSTRKKMGFGPPLNTWMRSSLETPIRSTLEDFDWELLSCDKELIESFWKGYFNREHHDATSVWALAQYASTCRGLNLQP